MRSTPSPPLKSVASLEARVHAAARLVTLDTLARRDALVGAPPLPSPPWPAASTFASDARAVAPLDPAAGALLAEAWLVAAVRRPAERYERALGRKGVVLRGEPAPVALRGAASAVMTERNGARREAVLAGADARAAETRDAARAVVDALRGAADALAPELLDAVLPDDDPAAVLSATEDLWRELDARAVKLRELDPTRLRWGDRLHAMVGPTVLAQVPPATWTTLAVAWWSRVGLEGAAGGVRDVMGASSRDAAGVHPLITEPGARAALAGRAAPSAWGAGEVMGAGSVAAGSTVARGLWVAHRRGVDRASDGALHALGRRLLHDRGFLHRVAGVDAGAREAVMLDALHAELARLRWDAVLGRFVRDALRRAPELGARFVEGVGRAWGAAPPLVWAAHVAADAMATGDALGARWGARSVGARAEAVLRARLRERFDEDWHRNPRAGEWLRSALDAMRGVGLRAWVEAEGVDASPAAMVKRLAEDFADARR